MRRFLAIFLPRGCFGLPLKFEYATFGWIKISGNKFFTVSLTGSGLEMTIIDRKGDSFGVWRSRLSFRFHGTVYQFPVQGTLAKNCRSSTQLLGEKKTTQLLNPIVWFWSTKVTSSQYTSHVYNSINQNLECKIL